MPYEFVQDETTARAVRRFREWLQVSSDAVYHDLVDVVTHHIPSLPPLPPRGVRFLRFTAPLALFIAAAEFNESNEDPLTQLYIAQAALSDLPPQLRRELELPQIVRETGRGDVYGSSLWLGLEPTSTPWHCDPNPNMFFQLCGAKVVRMALPKTGELIFRQVHSRLGKTGSPRIRGEEMMAGPERDLLDAAVWEPRHPADLLEARLGAGDALFIPIGWWHSVKSSSSDGRVNCSVNWWFR